MIPLRAAHLRPKSSCRVRRVLGAGKGAAEETPMFWSCRSIVSMDFVGPRLRFHGRNGKWGQRIFIIQWAPNKRGREVSTRRKKQDGLAYRNICELSKRIAFL